MELNPRIKKVFAKLIFLFILINSIYYYIETRELTYLIIPGIIFVTLIIDLISALNQKDK